MLLAIYVCHVVVFALTHRWDSPLTNKPYFASDAMADVEDTQPTTHDNADPPIDDSEDAESNVCSFWCRKSLQRIQLRNFCRKFC